MLMKTLAMETKKHSRKEKLSDIIIHRDGRSKELVGLQGLTDVHNSREVKITIKSRQ